MVFEELTDASHKVVRTYLGKRASHDDDEDCDNSSSSHCTRPVTNDALTIALAIVIPVVVILSVLGVFLYRNYRKGKKEAMEHDPDFDETGEATALPDFGQGKVYEMEDPFHNKNSVRYPAKDLEKGNKSSTSLVNTVKGDPYIDSFVLPYHQQTGSKVSLNDYARQIGDFSSYDRTPRVSAFMNNGRNSSATSLRDVEETRPRKNPDAGYVAKSKGGHEYETLPNESTTTINQSDSFDKEDNRVNQTTQSDLDTASEGNESLGVSKAPEFGVTFENESEVALNDTGLGFQTKSENMNHHATDNASRKKDKSISMRDESSNSIHPDPTINDSVDRNNQSTTSHAVENSERSFNESPFGDKNDNQTDETAFEEKNTTIDGDFDFSTDSTSQFDNDQNGSDTDFTTPPDTNHNRDFSNDNTQRRKSPRISAFNMLKNDSDDEDGEEVGIGLSEDQKEELKRMKSVYNVYFKGDGKRVEANLGDNMSDPNQYNAAEPDYLRVNRGLKVDSDYEKRLTTTSSIYHETPIFANEEEEVYHQPTQYAHPPVQYYGDPNADYSGAYEQLPPPELPPLQHLKNASDIRKSSLQTYTDFKPKPKGVTSPTARQPFNPIDNDNVWTSPINSPPGTSQPAFYEAHPGSQNSLSSVQGPTIPSATQLSRSSVVMLNPVTEITKHRKYKPAGSLPSMPSGNLAPSLHQGYIDMNQDLNNSRNDLIPSKRKSDLRRMMNSNF